MIKRILVTCLSLALSLGLYALDKEALADTLSAFVQSRAYVDKVTVSRVRVRKTQVFVYTNRSLSQVSLSVTVNELRSLL